MDHRLDRRQALRWLGVGAVGAVACACGASDRQAQPATTPASTGPAPTAVPTAPAQTVLSPPTRPATTPSTVGQPSTTSGVAAADPQAVAARFAGQRPAQWGTTVTGVDTRLATSAPVMALTFDACGGPHGSGVDRPLIDLLDREQVPATLFLNERWIDANPAMTEALIANPLFEIANHGTLHRPLSVTGRSAYGIAGCSSAAEAVDEVASNHARLTALLGHPPRLFRSGTAYYDEVGAAIVTALGETPVSFSVNGDAGATFTAGQIVRTLAEPPPGAIVLMHMNQPRHATATGVAAALPALRARGTRFVTLSGSGLTPVGD